ncbi:SAM-dependent chlorinase/fluorinase [Desulfococcaceae bacterium HSG9]|nr:SAM-dependent chlorinase/fluorinase [Desulfococcaceae bacterium HSG9]
MAIITLLTDFGTTDEYVGVMKGVILSFNPLATIVDITHHINPQNIIQAAYTLQAAYPFFPKGSVHVAVVDPGVGSDRSILALKKQGHIFLAPNNGVLTLLMQNDTVDELFSIENDAFFLKNDLNTISNTFHGRDIFSPVAAHLSMGLALSKLGPPAETQDVIRASLPQPFINENNNLIGTIIAIDHFGNLITDIDAACLRHFYSCDANNRLEISIGNHKINGLADSYADIAPQTALTLINSRDHLEIAINGGNAAICLSAQKGDHVILSIKSKGELS